MKKLWTIFLVILTFCLLPGTTAVAQQSEPPVVRAIMFMSPTCGHCHLVITEVLVGMTEEYGEQLQIVLIDVTQPGGGQLYQQAISHYNIPENRRGVPALIVNDVLLVGSGEIPDQFPAMVVALLEAGGTEWPDFPGLAEALAAMGQPTTETTATAIPPTPLPTATLAPPPTPAPAATHTAAEADTAVYLAYFYDPTCLECAQVSQKLDHLQKQYPQLVVNAYDLRQEAALNEALCEKYNVPADKRLLAPAIFIGSHCLTSGEISDERLTSLLQEPEPAAYTPPWDNLENNQAAASERLVARFQDIGLLAVAGAGLLDGINPCAFTTIIFFVSYLALVGRKGRDILFVGGAFTLAVFLTYLAMGLGLVEVVRQLRSFTLIGQIIYGTTAVICLILAGLSLRDYAKIRRGQLADITLQLPKSLKQRIHATIRTSSRKVTGYIGSAFVAGILVSIFELACTGQVYLPTIIFVSGMAEVRLKAILYLLLYNLMFVVPLLAVFTVTYFGTSSKQLTHTFQAHADRVKLFTAVLFTVLGLWLAYLVLVI